MASYLGSDSEHLFGFAIRALLGLSDGMILGTIDELVLGMYE